MTNKIFKIKSKFLAEYEIKNFITKNDSAIVVPLKELNQLTKNNISEIADACNQSEIYDLLFREKLKGEMYKEIDVLTFADGAIKGWADDTHFIFFIKNKYDSVIGAIDIKSNNPEDGEIGYWINRNYPGFMTNAVLGLICQTKSAGYYSLVAYVKNDNDKSKGVLNRAGFKYIGKEERCPGAIRDKYIFQIE